MKYFKYFFLLVMMALSVIGVISIYLHYNPFKSHTEISSTVLLERVEKVIKLTTVEGNFSEIYNYKDHIMYDIWPLRKKALLRVNAAVAVGFDFDQVIIDVNEDLKIITIKNMPPPDILSIDHNIDYFDLDNGLFNMITTQDITEMSIEAKEFIATKARESDLMLQAEKQRIELFEVLQLALQGAGWQLSTEEVVLKG